jgi:glycosyltransferase involved in cell wall biosynthesis
MDPVAHPRLPGTCPVSPSADRPLHVLLVTPGFPVDENDSTCLPYVQLWLDEAVRQGSTRFSVLAVRHPARRPPYRWHDIPVVAAGGLFRAIRGAVRLHRMDGVDVVHGLWLTDAAVVASAVTGLIRRPLVLSAMGQDSAGGSGWTRLASLRRAMVTAPSDWAADRMHDVLGRRPDRAVPWGVEAPAGAVREWAERDVDLLGVGSLVLVKAWGDFLEVCAALVGNGRVRRAVLIGAGSEDDIVRAGIERLGLREHVELLGERPRPEVLRWMERSKVLLHPARFEGFGLASVEALAAGAVVVSRATGAAFDGPRWRIGETTTELAALVDEVLTKAPAPVSFLPFPIDETVRQWDAVYREIAG